MFLHPLLDQHTVRVIPTNVLRNTCLHDNKEVHALTMPDVPQTCLRVEPAPCSVSHSDSVLRPLQLSSETKVGALFTAKRGNKSAKLLV